MRRDDFIHRAALALVRSGKLSGRPEYFDSDIEKGARQAVRLADHLESLGVHWDSAEKKS